MISLNTKQFFIILSLIVLVVFALLQPKLSSWLFPQKRAMILKEFLQDTQRKNTIDARKFWEFREFYYPGYFVFERDGLPTDRVNKRKAELDITIHPQSVLHPFLLYTSGKLNSLDFLVSANSIDMVIDTTKIKKDSIVHRTPSEIIYYDDPETLKIVFIKSDEEMVKANGYLNYRNAADVKVYEGKYWLSISSVQVN
jgi:hypothetical protein